VLLILLTLKLDSAQEDLKGKQEIRYRSYLLADELRQSSDDLTLRRPLEFPPPVGRSNSPGWAGRIDCYRDLGLRASFSAASLSR
jgi:hypothetical protein